MRPIMKFSAFLLAGAMVAAVPCLPAEASAQLSDGFREYRWGSPLQTMQERFELQLVQARGAYQQFDTDIYGVEDVTLQNCRFEFVDEKFCGIAILVGGRSLSRRLFDLLRITYGEAVQTSPIGYQWLSSATHVFYDEDRIGNAYVYIYSVDLQGDPEQLPGSTRMAVPGYNKVPAR
jgi:hypothetical protein